MKSAIGIAFGFLFPICILVVGGLFVWLMIKLDISKADFSLGAAAFFAILIVGLAVAVKMAP